MRCSRFIRKRKRPHELMFCQCAVTGYDRVERVLPWALAAA